MTAQPGPWRNERTPYLAGIMDAAVEDGVEQVIFLKAVQVGFSEAIRNFIGYCIDHDPGPMLLVMPTEQSAKELMDERIRPLVHETPKLREHVLESREDNKVHHTRLDTMSLFIAWANSPQSLASRPIRRIVFDETDKYPPYAGKEADPVSLGLKRVTTYGSRAVALIGSTPTTRVGFIWRAWETATDRRRFHVPCPKCGHEQPLIWSQVRWPERIDGESRLDQAERVESGSTARYHCAECNQPWTDVEKNAACRLGRWVSESPGASNRRIAFHLNSIYSPWVPISKLAGEWLRAQGNPAALMDFANSRLAEPFEEQASSTKPTLYEDKAKLAGPPMVCPAWAIGAFCTVDVQKDHLWYVIRAWGAGGRSHLIRYGMASSFDEIYNIAFKGTFATHLGEAAQCQFMAVDARHRTDEVYAFAARDPARILPVQGSAQLRSSPVTPSKVRGYEGVIKRSINPNHWKDVLHSLINDDDPTRWLPHNQVGLDYCKQMSSEHKIHDPRQNAYIWQEVSRGADNHLWDCEVLQTVLATESGVFVMVE